MSDKYESIESNPMYETFCQIIEYGDKLKAANYHTYRVYAPTTQETISLWEKENGILLPKAYKDWILLSNGYKYASDYIYPLEAIEACPDPSYADSYFGIAEYVGNGNMVIIDRKGNPYDLDYDNGMKKCTFEEFLEKVIIYDLRSGLLDLGEI